MESSSKKRTIIEYALIIALYYVTGGAFSYTKFSLQITAFFFISLVLCIFLGGEKYAFGRNGFIPWLIMTLFVMLVPLLFNDNISTYLAVIMQLGIGLFCASIISPNSFKQKYINIITFFAGVSLVGFAIGLVMPGVALRFPVTIGDASVDYYNAGIYVFMSPKGYASFFLTERNAGICWEPGCYQAFLNIGLLFLFNEEEKEHQKNFYFKFFILLITIMTTVSTTGIIILLMLLAVYFPIWRKGLKGGWLLIPLVLILLLWMFNNTAIGELIQTKINMEFNEDNGFLNRISLNKISYLFASDSGFPYLLGMSFSKWLTFNTSLWNSIIHSFLCLGTPFTLIHLAGYWKGSNFLVRKTGILFLIMIMCASTETLFWRVFFNTIAFYGWIGQREDKNIVGGVTDAACGINHCS